MSCSSCKSNSNVNNVKWASLLFGIYILGTSIYGNWVLIKQILELFK